MASNSLQNVGDRVHIALPKAGAKQKFYEACVYNIKFASANAGYNLIKKRRFGENRYPGYEHRITGRDDNANVANNSREFIFEKVCEINKSTVGARTILLKKGSAGNYKISNEYITRRALELISSDDDSSDYED